MFGVKEGSERGKMYTIAILSVEDLGRFHGTPLLKGCRRYYYNIVSLRTNITMYTGKLIYADLAPIGLLHAKPYQEHFQY